MPFLIATMLQKLGYSPCFAKGAGLTVMILSVFSIGIFIGSREIIMTDNVSYYANKMSVFTQKQMLVKKDETPVRWEEVFSFVPPTLKDCKELFHGQVNNMTYSLNYQFHKRVLDRLWETHRNNATWVEGHVGELPEQSRMYYELAKQGFVSNICEIGFNAGHSTFQWLSANDNVHVYSFDLGQYHYTHVMAEFLRTQFPGRLTMIYGDSTRTVPIFAQLGTKCDIVVIDGGHTYDVAKSDLYNMKVLANKQHHIVIFDDYPSER